IGVGTEAKDGIDRGNAERAGGRSGLFGRLLATGRAREQAGKASGNKLPARKWRNGNGAAAFHLRGLLTKSCFPRLAGPSREVELGIVIAPEIERVEV